MVPILKELNCHVTIFSLDDSRYYDELSLVLSMNVFLQSDRDTTRDRDSDRDSDGSDGSSSGVDEVKSVVFNADKDEGVVNHYPVLRTDPIRISITKESSEFVLLPVDIHLCAQAVRKANLDILIYPEIGGEPISYFLSFARLAPIQALYLGDGDTSGVSNIDYYITSVEDKSSKASFYSEKVFKMFGLGTVFYDHYTKITKIIKNTPRLALLEKARFAESLGLPRTAHLYILANPLSVYHPKFDDALIRILSQDKLGYVVIIDSVIKKYLHFLFIYNFLFYILYSALGESYFVTEIIYGKIITKLIVEPSIE